MRVLTPVTCRSSVKRPVTLSCHRLRLGVCSSVRRQSCENRALSHWARGLHMAGPFERFSIRNWIVERSVTMPVYPPIASISRTICPLATPPMAGLHDICANLVISIVTSSVRQPILAAAAAASHPACPPPITIMSNSNSILQSGAAAAVIRSGARAPSVRLFVKQFQVPVLQLSHPLLFSGLLVAVTAQVEYPVNNDPLQLVFERNAQFRALSRTVSTEIIRSPAIVRLSGSL